MSWDINSPNTGTTLSTLSPNDVRIIWQKTIDLYEQTEDFFGQFEGDSKDDPVLTTTDTSKGAGLRMRVTTRAGYYGRGKSGDSLFLNSSDFEIDNISDTELQLDYLRDATSITLRADEYMGMRGELASGQVEELGKWMGREKNVRMMMTMRLKGAAQNLLIAGGGTNQDTIKTANGLTYSDGILRMGQALKPLGGRPCKVATIRGQAVKKYCVVGTTAGLFSLKQDSDYKLLLRDAMPREKYDQNPLFTGGYAELDGHSIREYEDIDHDGYGPVGSPFNAKAFLGTAIAAGTAAFAITGGGSAAAAALTNIDYFRYFPGFAFEFLPTDIFAPANDTRYLLIVNPSNAAVDPGKFGFYAYTTGNNGNTITITQRLSPVQNGPAALVTVGNVTWNTGPWLNLHSQTHPIGATIIHCNSYGVPLGDTVMFGAAFALRGYGMYRNKRTQWEVDGGHETRKYITTVFGQCLRKNVRGVFPGYVRLRHAISYPELGLPVIT